MATDGENQEAQERGHPVLGFRTNQVLVLQRVEIQISALETSIIRLLWYGTDK
jgi:hypothetical protein